LIVDANVLLYARNDADARHPAARVWLEDALNGSTRVGLPWWSLSAFVRIATNVRAFPSPLSPEEAALQVEEWLDAPRAWLPEPTAQYRDVLMSLIRAYDVRGSLVTDAQLAALAIDHGVPIVSTDTDVARFRSVEWINPLNNA
jgi:toxin-antitoxin system PIN domain toxin